MLAVADALRLTLEHTPRLHSIKIPLSTSSLGRVLAEDILADLDSPPFAKSLRDGYGIRLADINTNSGKFRVGAEVSAGAATTIIWHPNEAVRIFTGAPIPTGVDAVVMQEDCKREGEFVTVSGNIRAGQYILPRGSEYGEGDIVLPAGIKLMPQEIGMLAAVGKQSLSIYPAPRIGILSTGSEIVEVSEKPTGSQIRNSNGPMLMAQCMRAGATGEYLGIVPDDRAQLISRVADGLDRFDMLVVSGGVSVGDHDHLPHILEELGITSHVRQVAMKPGKPMLFGTRGKKMLFGLPGNPVSSFVCFELFVRPAIDKASGNQIADLPWIELPLVESFSTNNDRPTFFPASVAIENWAQTVRPNGKMNSASLNSMSNADAIVSVPPGSVSFKSGDLIRTLRLNR